MKVLLMNSATDTTTNPELDEHQTRLFDDLGLATLVETMGGGDTELRDIATAALLHPLTTAAEIRYRQAVLRDFLAHPALAEDLYALALAGIETRKHVRWGFMGRRPSSVLSFAVELGTLLLEQLRALRAFAERTITLVGSPGLIGFCERVLTELDDTYLATIEGTLAALKFPGGVVMSAGLNDTAVPDRLVLHRSEPTPRGWRAVLGLSSTEHVPTVVYQLAERDESGSRALSEIVEAAENRVADTLAQSTDHLLGFFRQLRWETGFYLGAVRLHDALTTHARPVCFPDCDETDPLSLTATQLCDVVLALRRTDVVGSDLDADGHGLVMVTGSNQGGKSTFLRALGAAHLMTQAGLFVLADTFTSSPATGIFSHYRRPEDETLESGKLEEELVRLDHIVAKVTPRSLLLMNESLACTNERDGSQIGREVVGALTEAGIRVVFVTHHYHLANTLLTAPPAGVRPLFLVPERLEDGTRTFRIVPGAPRTTSHARDLFRDVFGDRPQSRSTV